MQASKATKKFRQLFWQWVHNVVAHGLEGWIVLFTLGRKEPEWLNRFHDWTAGKAWDEGIQIDVSVQTDESIYDLTAALVEENIARAIMGASVTIVKTYCDGTQMTQTTTIGDSKVLSVDFQGTSRLRQGEVG